MKKKIVFRIIALFLIIGGSVYYYNEYKTKSLLSDLLHIENLNKEKDYISILYESELEKKTTKVNIVRIDKSNLLFPNLINSLENLKVKQNSKASFSNTEEYMLIIHHNYIPYHVSIYGNGSLTFGTKNYKIQGQQSMKELLDLTKKSTQYAVPPKS